MNDNWERCPRCDSNKVTEFGTIVTAIMGLFLFGVGFPALIILPLGLILICLGLALLISSPGNKGQLRCEDCNYAWKPEEEREEEGIA